MRGKIRSFLVGVTFIGIAIGALRARAQPHPVEAAPVRITWEEGTEYPLGIQDSVLGVLHGQLIAVGGFTRHPKDVVRRHPDAFGGAPSGFTRIGFALDLQAKEPSWTRIPDMPGAPRQGAAMAVVDHVLYAFGGCSYSEPYTYRDVVRLRRHGREWVWETLPCELPWPVCEAGTAVIGKKVYLVGGADYYATAGAPGADFHSEKGRTGAPVGGAILELDTNDLKSGWRRLPDRPGTAMFDLAVAGAGGKVYVLGGIFAPAGIRTPQYYNARDAWVFDPTAGTWTRLPDMPHGANRRAISWRDRYILLVAGYKYGHTWNPDGTHTEIYTPEEKARDWRTFFERNVLVFDSRSRTLSATDPLLDATSWPMLALDGDQVYSLGGEGGARLWHPATLQIGRLRASSRAK